MSATTDRNDPRLREYDADGQQKAYLVLSEEERALGFVRPLRRSYKHVGAVTRFTNDATGATWEQRTGACGGVTSMGDALCETYARQPSFYSGTYCSTCHQHRPVREFVWMEDGAEVGS